VRHCACWIVAFVSVFTVAGSAARAQEPACKHLLLPFGGRAPIHAIEGLSVCLYDTGIHDPGAPELRFWFQNIGSARTAKQTLVLDIQNGGDVLLLSIPVELPPLEAGAVGDVWVPVRAWPQDGIGWHLTAG
jgi:hypothetical protein